ncbi:MAG TPA: OmpA family protein [Nitrospiraceae bacterium]|nr:OmpA family protein [Nitrospiraceae bacterium]
MRGDGLKIGLIGSMGLLILATGCASRTVTGIADKSVQEERVVEPLARLPLATARDAATSSGSSDAENQQLGNVPSLFLFDIPFNFDQYALRFDAAAKIEVNAMRLKEQEEEPKDLLLEGRCDEFGTVEYNLVLGERRAQAVKRYLIDLGIPETEIATVSYGKDKPVCLDHTSECWAKNRTVHFVVK